MAISLSNAADGNIPAAARLCGAYLHIIFGAFHLQAAQVRAGGLVKWLTCPYIARYIHTYVCLGPYVHQYVLHINCIGIEYIGIMLSLQFLISKSLNALLGFRVTRALQRFGPRFPLEWHLTLTVRDSFT